MGCQREKTDRVYEGLWVFDGDVRVSYYEKDSMGA